MLEAVIVTANTDGRNDRILDERQEGAKTVTGLPVKTAGQLVGAIKELESNVHEHSEAVETGQEPFIDGFFVSVHCEGARPLSQLLRRLHDGAKIF